MVRAGVGVDGHWVPDLVEGEPEAVERVPDGLVEGVEPAAVAEPVKEPGKEEPGVALAAAAGAGGAPLGVEVCLTAAGYLSPFPASL